MVRRVSLLKAVRPTISLLLVASKVFWLKHNGRGIVHHRADGSICLCSAGSLVLLAQVLAHAHIECMPVLVLYMLRPVASLSELWSCCLKLSCAALVVQTPAHRYWIVLQQDSNYIPHNTSPVIAHVSTLACPSTRLLSGVKHATAELFLLAGVCRMPHISMSVALCA